MKPTYATDLTDGQWALLTPYFPEPDRSKGGRPRLFSHREILSHGEILDAIFYIEKTGCQWRMLPKGFPEWGLVWQYFRRWRDDGTLEAVRLALNRKA
ncbi:MAG: hypothetical protein OHK0029_38280 [Armatimonadaceae bacterium]